MDRKHHGGLDYVFFQSRSVSFKCLFLVLGNSLANYFILKVYIYLKRIGCYPPYCCLGSVSKSKPNTLGRAC